MKNLFNTINGKRINLIKVDLKYLNDFYEYGSNKKLYKFLYGIDLFTSKKNAKKFLETLIKKSDKKNGFWWFIYHKEMRKVIGSIGTHNFHFYNKSLEISYALSVEYWGKGFFSETLKLIINRFVNEFNFERIYAITEINNLSSIMGLKNNSFVEEGTLRNYVTDNRGNKKDCLIFSFCKEYDLNNYLNKSRPKKITNRQNNRNNILRSKIKFPSSASDSTIIKFFNSIDLKYLVKESYGYKQSVNELIVDEPYIPVLRDLYRLYKFITLNKRINILEFGSGWSSLVLSLALNQNKNNYSNTISELRRNNPFELLILDNQKKYFNISKNRVSHHYKKYFFNDRVKINWHFSSASMTKFNGRFATEYDSMPLFSPDFIYLDGPDQFQIKQRNHNYNINHPDLMPMSCDILKIEQFLVPGTIIVVDGRAANALFLKNNFQRSWLYEYDENYDQHIFYLDDYTLGKYNTSQLEFYRK